MTKSNTGPFDLNTITNKGHDMVEKETMTSLSSLDKVSQVQHNSFRLSNSGQRHRPKMKLKCKKKERKKKKAGTHLFCFQFVHSMTFCFYVTQWKSSFKFSTMWMIKPMIPFSCQLRWNFRNPRSSQNHFKKPLLLINKIPIKKGTESMNK